MVVGWIRMGIPFEVRNMQQKNAPWLGIIPTDVYYKPYLDDMISTLLRKEKYYCKNVRFRAKLY